MAGKLRKPEPMPPDGIETELTNLTELCFHCGQPTQGKWQWCEACYTLNDHLSEMTRKLRDTQERKVAYTVTPEELTALHICSEMMVESFLYPYLLQETFNRYLAYDAELTRWEALNTSGIGASALDSTTFVRAERAKHADREATYQTWLARDDVQQGNLANPRANFRSLWPAKDKQSENN